MKNPRGTVGKCEFDTHADTTAFGSNFEPLFFTGQQVDVTPFSDEYTATKDIHIATGATAYTHQDTGTTYILVVNNKGLWLESRMKHSLINPNQLCMFGVNLCNDPFDKHHALQFIECNSGITVPFETQGTNIFFKTRRCPTQEELDTCQHVILSSDAPWNPSTLELSINSRSIEEEERICIVAQFSRIKSDDDVDLTFQQIAAFPFAPKKQSLV
jgi:hypothetical protein